MSRNFFFKLSLIVCLGFSLLRANAQQLNTLYFMENVPIRHTFNPAFQTFSNFYIGLPVIGNTQASLWNNSLTLKDLAYKLPNGQSIWFANQNGDKNKFYNALQPTTLIQADVQLNLLDFGFRTGDSYWTFGLTEKIDGKIGVPKELMSLLLFGTQNMYTNAFNFQGLDAGVSQYTEAALGYSLKLNEQINVGASLKLLLGHFNASLSTPNLEMNAGIDKFTLNGSMALNYASSYDIQMSLLPPTVLLNTPVSTSDLLKISGMGGGIDLGITYKPIEKLTLSAAIVDLGFIGWNKNFKNETNSIHYTYEGSDSFSADMQKNLQHITSGLTDSITTTQTANPYTTYTSPKLNIGAEYSFFDDKLSVGLLSRTTKRNSTYVEELTASVNGRPIDWFNMSASYSILNGKFSNIGLGLGIRAGFINWFVSADYTPLIYSAFPLTVINKPLTVNIPYNSQGYNFAIGVNFVFGNRKDYDHDGVVDKKDKCPETPYSVIVDKNGCPLDTDGDGVPDYLDKCAKTPVAAYNRINQDGCPTDNDGDGVPDYLDKCPDTPKQAFGFIDKDGCPIDTDVDGVPDYKDKCPNTVLGMKVDTLGCPFDTDGDGVFDNLDKCPNTPAGAKGFVTNDGCLLDSDTDSVPDYLDKCPNTPIEARRFVDKNGCPLDTDGDGVFDYLDKCPNTPVAERKLVDKNGCSGEKDSDGDGVPDSLDKCPNTPIEARGFVDKNGCPLDTDGDGVLDYMDNCPKVKGSASNKGCPDAKREILNLFHKALQGIQFETAKYTFMPVSYKIMNQIAGVLIANPTYNVEIRGHTDNQGKSSTNLILSLNRSKAVMKYLIRKGVAPSRMTANGYGDTLPVATNKTQKGRSINRRVEFIVTFEEIKFE